jgi:glycosyltransferase involved in cell wall biosynthesis
VHGVKVRPGSLVDKLAERLQSQNMACGLADVQTGVTVGLDVDRTIWPALWPLPVSSALDRRIGSNRPNEGLNVLLRTLAYARGRLTGRRPITVGAVPACGELYAQLARLGLVAGVVLAKHFGNAHPTLRGAALVVVSSRSEGISGIIRLGAMAHGMPIMATDCRFGLRDLLKDERCGLLVPNEDVGALAQVVAARIADPTDLRARARRGPDRARKFSTEWWTDGLRTPLTPLASGRR